jgi:hypothetical protein
MYHDFEDDLFLAPETTVSVHFDAGAQDENDDIDPDDALREAQCDAWARHAAGSNGFGGGLAAFDTRDDEQPMTLRQAIRLVMELP